MGGFFLPNRNSLSPPPHGKPVRFRRRPRGAIASNEIAGTKGSDFLSFICRGEVGYTYRDDSRRDNIINRPVTIFLVAGARPNFMKVAPVYHALAAGMETARSVGIDLHVSIVHTGQHYDENMSDVFFRDLGIPPPDWHLEVGSGSHAEQTARIMIAFEKVVLEDHPYLVAVVGGVNSTIACALTAKKLGVRVAHVEAGLRSFDMGMPEEINRKLTDAISDLLFVTEESGVRNLRAEGVPGDKIFLVGNVMIDTLLRNLARIESGE